MFISLRKRFRPVIRGPLSLAPCPLTGNLRMVTLFIPEVTKPVATATADYFYKASDLEILEDGKGDSKEMQGGMEVELPGKGR